MHSKAMRLIVKSEYLVAAIIVAAIFISLGFSWYWLIVLFLLFDVSMAGYLINKKTGAVLYNLVHSLVGPGILLVLYIVLDGKLLLFVALLWLFHIFVDRTLGYGLKHVEGFHHTHMGKIGKSAK